MYSICNQIFGCQEQVHPLDTHWCHTPTVWHPAYTQRLPEIYAKLCISYRAQADITVDARRPWQFQGTTLLQRQSRLEGSVCSGTCTNIAFSRFGEAKLDTDSLGLQ
jgi:hypothetical protein